MDHGDLKPSNIIVDANNNITWYVADQQDGADE